MANNDIVWRKLPIGIIRDEDMDLISDLLPPELKAAPYMFYMTAICKADNDGIFDLEDGLIFSRLMRIGTPDDVFKIAELMARRNILQVIEGSTRCFFTAWDYPLKEKPRTINERRQIVARQIEETQNNQRNIFTINKPEATGTHNIFTGRNNNDSGAQINRNFFSNLNDKNAENVTKKNYDDKNQENVVEKNQTEREKERIEREHRLRIERIETHTEEERIDTEKLALQAQLSALRTSGEEYTAEGQEIPEAQKQETSDNALGTLQRNGMTEPTSEEVRTQLYSILTNFFTKNYLGFNEAQNAEDISRLIDRIGVLGDRKNPPSIVATVILGQYKKLLEENEYYKGAPMTPQQLLKPGTYGHVMQAASKILLSPGQNKSTWISQMQQYEQEVEAEKLAVGDGIDMEYVKYGIDPADPSRAVKLMQAKAAGAKQENEPP